MNQVKDITGQRFGRFVVIGHLQGDLHNCVCDCGNERTVTRRNLISGNSKSCGCLRAEGRRAMALKLEGKRFGFLTVLKRTPKGHFACRCECGNLSTVAVTALTRGIVKSCGCKNGNHPKQISWRTREIELAKERALETLAKSLFKAYQNEARKKAKPWNLSIAHFSSLLKGKCHYCDSPALNVRKHTRLKGVILKYNGIDRLDNSKGYSLENCVSCCKRCNSAKNDMTQTEFTDWVVKVYWKTVFA